MTDTIAAELQRIDAALKRHFAADPDNISGRERLLMRYYDLLSKLPCMGAAFVLLHLALGV